MALQRHAPSSNQKAVPYPSSAPLSAFWTTSGEDWIQVTFEEPYLFTSTGWLFATQADADQFKRAWNNLILIGALLDIRTFGTRAVADLPPDDPLVPVWGRFIARAGALADFYRVRAVV